MPRLLHRLTSVLQPSSFPPLPLLPPSVVRALYSLQLPLLPLEMLVFSRAVFNSSANKADARALIYDIPMVCFVSVTWENITSARRAPKRGCVRPSPLPPMNLAPRPSN